MSIKYLNKYVKPKKEKKKRLKNIKKLIRYNYLYHIKPMFSRIYDDLRWINKLPFSILFMIFLIFLFISGGFYNKVTGEKWKNNVIARHPEYVEPIVDEEGIHLSPLDQIFVEFIATKQAEDLIFFNLIISLFVLKIWHSYNPRKPQSFHLRMGK